MTTFVFGTPKQGGEYIAKSTKDSPLIMTGLSKQAIKPNQYPAFKLLNAYAGTPYDQRQFFDPTSFEESPNPLDNRLVKIQDLPLEIKPNGYADRRKGQVKGDAVDIRKFGGLGVNENNWFASVVPGAQAYRIFILNNNATTRTKILIEIKTKEEKFKFLKPNNFSPSFPLRYDNGIYPNILPLLQGPGSVKGVNQKAWIQFVKKNQPEFRKEFPNA
jgi:hypothetical protein